MSARSDATWMEAALEAAERARQLDEVPVGAVIVIGHRLVVSAHNTRETDRDPTAHAEIVALREAARILGRWRLDDATLFVTLEPCAMCAGALVNARIGRLVYGAEDPRAGAVRSLFRLVDDPRLNHRIPVSTGVLAERAGALLRAYFKAKRPNPSPDRFSIRPARPSDAIGLVRVATSAVRAAWTGRASQTEVEARVRQAKRLDWAEAIASGRAVVFVATREASGAIVGFSSLTPRSPNTTSPGDSESAETTSLRAEDASARSAADLWGGSRAAELELAVLRELRRRGLGRRLFEEASSWARAQSVSTLRARCPRGDAERARFFEAIGGRETTNTEAQPDASSGAAEDRSAGPEDSVSYFWSMTQGPDSGARRSERREGDSNPR